MTETLFRPIPRRNLQYVYAPKCKPNQLICGQGQTALVTGWTLKEAVSKHLQPEEFAAIGHLYSPTRGISFLIRNLIANPHVRFLVALIATKEDRNAGGCKCLLDFFRYGFKEGTTDSGRKCWIILSEVPGYIDLEIPIDVLETLRTHILCEETTSVAEAVKITKLFARGEAMPPWGEPLEFAIPEITPTILPGTRYGHRIEGKTIAETWVKIIHRIKTTGTIRPTTYDGRWQELIDLMAVVTDEPDGFFFPQPNYLPIERSFIEQYLDQILVDTPYKEGVKYTYAQRLRSWFGCDQIEQVIKKLTGDIDSASAVMSLWDAKDHDWDGGSPCLNHIWIRIVDGEMSLTATFRSNDMFSAWPANAMGLRALQQHIRDEISNRSNRALRLGPMITISQSAHIYDDTWESADRIIEQQYFKNCKSKDYNDPCGNFLIEVDGENIVVKQTTSGSGEVVASYAGKDPLKLLKKICDTSPALQAEHAGYLGIELQTAVACIQNGGTYIQDRGCCF